MGIPSSNVQYHPPRLSENQLNLPQPHSPSLPTHCSGKSGMRPLGLGRHQPPLHRHRLVADDHHEGDCRDHRPKAAGGRNTRSPSRWRTQSDQGDRCRAPARAPVHSRRDDGGRSNEPPEVDHQVHPGPRRRVDPPGPFRQLAHGRAAPPRPRLLAAVESQDHRRVGSSAARRPVPLHQPAGETSHHERRPPSSPWTPRRKS